MPSDADTIALKNVLLNTNKYALTTWWNTAKNFDSQDASTYLSFGGTTEHFIRHPAVEAMALAITLKTGTYDAAQTGVSAEEAKAKAVKLVRSVAFRHKVNSSGGWGDLWQSAHWAGCAAYAGWLLWDDLAAVDREYVRKMVEYESNRFNSYVVEYYRNRAGALNFPGDSKGEENAWNSWCLQVATAMMPGHPNWHVWMDKNLELMLATFSRPMDLNRTDIYHGRPLRDWLNGSNSNNDGTLINHSRVHPDYMASGMNEFSPSVAYPLAGMTIPAAGFFNLEETFRAFVELNFVAGAKPYADAATNAAPGGTIFQTGTSNVYYPHGNDWGTHRRMNYVVVFANARAFLSDPALQAAAAALEPHHTQYVANLQARFTDGRTYGAAAEDTYQGREEWVAYNAARAYMLRWLLQQDAIEITNDPYVSVACTSPALTLSETNPGAASLTFRRTGLLSRPLTIQHTIGGSAIAGKDYHLFGSTLSFAAGQETVALSLSSIADDLPEGAETVQVALQTDAAYTISGSATQQVTIQDAPFDQWRYERYAATGQLTNPAMVGAAADPDANGWGNLVEFASGAAATGAAAFLEKPLVAPLELEGEEYLALTYYQSKAAGEVAFVPQASGDLVQWVSGNAVFAAVQTEDLGDKLRITVRDKTPIGSGPRFLRLHYALEAPGPGQMEIEAETGTLIEPFQIATDPAASGGSYIVVPDGTGDQGSSTPARGIAEYHFVVEQAGDYVVWARIFSTGPTNDTFWISVDNGAFVRWNLATGPGWHWDMANAHGGADPLVTPLTAGAHRVRIAWREDGAGLDKIVITTSRDQPE